MPNTEGTFIIGTQVPGIEKFFDILEEVKIEEQTTIETLFDRSSLGDEEMTTYQKSIPYGAKGVQVEESKKEYTGDALALGGDEGRDKLR